MAGQQIGKVSMVHSTDQPIKRRHHRYHDRCVFCNYTHCDATGIVVRNDRGDPVQPCTLVSMHDACFTENSLDGYTASTK